jgi:glycerol dehydrogenase-like iron-containing ADH family enzyme
MKNNVIYGRNLLGELPLTVDSPFLLVTMPDLWPIFKDRFDESKMYLHLVDSIEETDLDAIIAKYPTVRNIVGLGGGQAIDVAKYVAWKAQLPLFQVPTALSVNAPFAQRAAARVDGVIKYVGFKQPETVYIDLDIIQAAPSALNRSGVGDIFCYYTGHADWRLADRVGKCEPKWPINEEQMAEAHAVMMSCYDAADDIREMNEHGIRVLVEALRWGGAAFANNGWSPRPIEGSEHTFFYTLEYLTKKHFLHGQPVGLGTILMALLQEDNDAEWVKDALDRCGVPYLPEDMGVTWEECVEALRYMPTYAEQAGLWYTAATYYEITDEYLEQAHELVYRAAK